MNMIEHFDRTRVINLATRADRREETKAEFARLGVALPSDKAAFFAAVCPGSAEGFPSAGVRGCFLSHMTVLEEALRDGAGSVLVVEDDIAFSKRADEHGRAAVEALGSLEWDLVYLGHAHESDPVETCWRAVDRPMLLAHLYAVNGRALPRLVAFLRQVLARPPGHPDGGPMHYDGALNTFLQQNPDVKAYYFSKNLAYQRPSKTNLHAVSALDRYAFLEPVAALLRGVKRAYLRRVK